MKCAWKRYGRCCMKRAPIWRSWRIEDKAEKNRSPTNINIWNIYSIMVIKMIYGIERKKVDEQGRFVLPSDWRAAELKERKEVFVIKGKGYLKIVPKKKVDLTRFFDSADLGMNIEDWDEFERRIYEQ